MVIPSSQCDVFSLQVQAQVQTQMQIQRSQPESFARVVGFLTLDILRSLYRFKSCRNTSPFSLGPDQSIANLYRSNYLYHLQGCTLSIYSPSLPPLTSSLLSIVDLLPEISTFHHPYRDLIHRRVETARRKSWAKGLGIIRLPAAQYFSGTCKVAQGLMSVMTDELE
jgi:hypothetical protein